jgi:hypothetical protein
MWEEEEVFIPTNSYLMSTKDVGPVDRTSRSQQFVILEPYCKLFRGDVAM